MIKATYTDLYNSVSFHEWKTGMELRNELERADMKIGHMRGTMYIHLAQWEDDGFIISRIRSGQENTTYEFREYLRVSKGIPKGLFARREDSSGLEEGVVVS